jgi:hypothetical protein
MERAPEALASRAPIKMEYALPLLEVGGGRYYFRELRYQS